MGLILDSSVLISWERDRFDLDGLLASVKEDSVAIASITASELLHGVERASNEASRLRRGQRIEGVFDIFPVIPFGLPEARVHARLWASLARKGKVIGAHDLQVAATAMARSFSVATLNAKEFRRVSGLALHPATRFERR